MTDHPQQLNPPQTPLCQEYNELREMWRRYFWQSKTVNEVTAKALFDKIHTHRASCPVCQARKAEFDELARNAKEPEVKDER